VQTPFTHTEGKISGTKTILSVLASAVAIRLLAPLWGYPELDLTGAAAILAAAGGNYGIRRWTERRYHLPDDV